MFLRDTPLIEEWDWEKNNAIHLYGNSVTTKSSKYAYWIGKDCKHSWCAQIYTRSYGNGCPYCAHRKVLKGFNDLATVDKDLLLRWDFDKNTIKPDEVFPCSKKKAFWKCNICGYEYEAVIASQHGHGCPKCSRRKP